MRCYIPNITLCTRDDSVSKLFDSAWVGQSETKRSKQKNALADIGTMRAFKRGHAQARDLGVDNTCHMEQSISA